MAEATQNTGYYDIVKLCKGGLVLNMPAFDSSAINRRVEFKYNIDKIRVPRTFALGIFVDGTLERMYKNGYFKVEPAKQFEKEVADIFFPVEDKVEVADDATIKNALLKGDRKTIKKLLEDDVNRENIIIIARENIGELSTSMIKDVESYLGVELTVENE
jgi:hypothetical protein